MKKLTLILLAIILTSCSTQRKIQYHFKKLKALGVEFKDDTTVITKIDTFASKDTISLTLNDTIIMEATKYVQSSTFDTAKFKKLVLKSISIPETKVQDSTYNLKLRVENGLIHYDLDVFAKTKIVEVQKDVKIPQNKSLSFTYFLLVAIIAFFLGALIGMKFA